MPYSAAQLYSYEVFKKLFQNDVGAWGRRLGRMDCDGAGVLASHAQRGCRCDLLAPLPQARRARQACRRARVSITCAAGGPPQLAAAPAGGRVRGHGGHAGELWSAISLQVAVCNWHSRMRSGTGQPRLRPCNWPLRLGSNPSQPRLRPCLQVAARCGMLCTSQPRFALLPTQPCPTTLHSHHIPPSHS